MDSTAFFTPSWDGVAVGHENGQIHRHLLIFHLHMHALGQGLLSQQFGNIAAQIGGQAADSLHLQGGGGGNTSQHFFGNMDIAQLVRAGDILLILAHGWSRSFTLQFFQDTWCYCTTPERL